MNSEFTSIPGYDDYIINTDGIVAKILKTQMNKTGYKYISLTKNKCGGSKHVYIHKLIGMTFLGAKYDQKNMCINHMDGNKLNNNINNLEYVSFSDNLKHAYKTGLRKPSYHMLGKSGFEHHLSHAIKIIYPDGKEEIFGSLRECDNTTKFSRSTISKYLKSGKLFNGIKFEPYKE